MDDTTPIQASRVFGFAATDGRRVLRPLIALVLLWLGGATVYYFLAPVQKPLTLLIVSLRETNFNEICTSLDCWPIDLLMFAQSILSLCLYLLTWSCLTQSVPALDSCAQKAVPVRRPAGLEWLIGVHNEFFLFR
ncbi:MAG: hypothetical protein HRT36_03935 [Alphaproteobacteria bacterium]|nr:hypothetical protein [Alphaproteobacteria bacterium]